MWEELLTLYQSTHVALSQWVADEAAAHQLTAEERSALEQRLPTVLESLIRSQVEQRCQLIVLYMRKRFDRLFRYDEDGFIRKWKARDDVRALFKECCAKALTELDLFATFRLAALLRPDAPLSEADVLITPTRRMGVEAEFPEEVEGALREAESEQERRQPGCILA